MSGYSPVLLGETPDLRQEIESVFTTSEEAVVERLQELDVEARRQHNLVTFGAEVEATFAPNPSNPDAPDIDDLDRDIIDKMYLDVVRELTGSVYLPREWPKGSVIDPRYDGGPVMLNRAKGGIYNSEQYDIMELRTGPAHAVEAADRYWATIQAIGKVAERYGYMAVILATHINAAVLRDDSTYGKFIDFASDFEGGKMLAAVQRNLNAMNTLQTHAGLEEGLVALEAYPNSKHASTAVHGIRLEVRHPSIGIVDPRVDMLAVLDGVNRATTRNLTNTEMAALHLCTEVDTVLADDRARRQIPHDLIDSTTSETLWDFNSGKFVMPALFQHNSGNVGGLTFANLLLDNQNDESLIDSNAQAIRRALGGLSIRRGKLTFRGGEASRFIRGVVKDARSVVTTNVVFGDDLFRVVPDVFYDSPETHAERRAHVARSASVRRIMGASLAALTPAHDAIKWRSGIIDNMMVEEL